MYFSAPYSPKHRKDRVLTLKILMVNKFLFPNGGSETYVFKLGEFLISQGHEVEYFGMDHETKIGSNSANAYVSNIDFHTHKLHKFLYPFKIVYSVEARKKIKVVLETFKPHVVHLNNFNFQITPSILYEIKAYERKYKKHIAIIYTAHDYQLVCPNHMMNIPSTKMNCERCLEGSYKHCVEFKCIHNSLTRSLIGAFEGYLYKKLDTYRFIDRVICPSIFMEGKISANSALKGKTVVLHNFISEVEDFHLEKERYVLYFGRFSEEKGIETLLLACKALPHIPFVFAGAGPLEKSISSLTNIRNEGFLTGKALEALILKASFSVYPSEWYENCPFSVMESQIMGTPVIGANIGGIPELIKEGVTGELFSSGNPDSLAQAIERLWNDPDTLSLYTKNCLSMKFPSLPEYCDQLMKIYQT